MAAHRSPVRDHRRERWAVQRRRDVIRSDIYEFRDQHRRRPVHLGLCRSWHWARQMGCILLAGMPFLISPGVLRLGLLLLASLTLFAAYWRHISAFANSLSRNRAVALRSTAIFAFCLPFIFGSFYLTSHSYDRHLSHEQRNNLWLYISQIPQNKLHPILVGAVSDPEAESYASQFLYCFEYYRIPTVEIYGDPPDNTILMPFSTRGLGRVVGMSIGVHDIKNPPETAKAFFTALQSAGFPMHYEKFYGQIPYNSEFIFIISYNH
jgi:hypothetical protein